MELNKAKGNICRNRQYCEGQNYESREGENYIPIKGVKVEFGYRGGYSSKNLHNYIQPEQTFVKVSGNLRIRKYKIIQGVH